MKTRLTSLVLIVALVSVSVSGCTSRESGVRNPAQVVEGGDVGNSDTNHDRVVREDTFWRGGCLGFYQDRSDDVQERNGVLGGTAAMISFFALTPALGPFVLIPIGGAAAWIIVSGVKPMGSASKMSQLILDGRYVNTSPEMLELVEKQHPKMFHRIDQLTSRVTGIQRDQNPAGFLEARKKVAKVIDEADMKREFCSGKKAVRYGQADEFVKAKLGL